MRYGCYNITNLK
jgi:hypothetical protein